MKNERIKKIVASDICMIMISQKNNIWRWKLKENSCQEYELPERKEESNKILGGAGQLFNAIRKPFGEETAKKDQIITINKVFMNKLGFFINNLNYFFFKITINKIIGHHAILCSHSGDNYYFHYNSDKIKYLYKLRGIYIRCIAWGEIPYKDSTNVIFF